MDERILHARASSALRWASVAVALWCLGAALAVWFQPVVWEGQLASAKSAPADSLPIYGLQSFSDWAGPSGIVLLTVPFLMAAVTSFALWRDRPLAALPLALLLLLYSLVAGFTIGGAFVAAGVAMTAVAIGAWGVSLVARRASGPPDPTR